MADEKIAKLVKRRSCMKSKLTVFGNYLHTLESCNELSSLQLLDLETRFNKFGSLYDDFDKLQCDIEMLSEEPDDEGEEREQFENQYYKLVAAARRLLGARPHQSSQLPDESVASCGDGRSGGFKSNCNHFLFSCEAFRSLSIEERRQKAKDAKKKHSTLLHMHEAETTVQPSLPVSNLDSFSSSTDVLDTTTPPIVLLSTALVRVVDSKGNVHTARVLLDNGSTANFVSEFLCGISLADPSFNTPSAVDILLGADIFWSVLCNNSIDLGKNQPKLYETKLGWLVSGSQLDL
ncbi:hypothetical protein SFRURICE_002601 [Spodoptera frugiperda]|nr:hypothetical protein SFRURICE_002601 [Spodoptera frugiperda]